MKLSPYRAALSVSNVEKISRWYQDTLGFQFIRRMDFDGYGAYIIYLESNGFGFELIERNSSKSKKERLPDLDDTTLLHGITKIGFLVEDIDSVAETMKEKGVRIIYDVTDDPEEDVSWMIIEDPDGNFLQFFEPNKYQTP